MAGTILGVALQPWFTMGTQSTIYSDVYEGNPNINLDDFHWFSSVERQETYVTYVIHPQTKKH